MLYYREELQWELDCFAWVAEKNAAGARWSTVGMKPLHVAGAPFIAFLTATKEAARRLKVLSCGFVWIRDFECFSQETETFLHFQVVLTFHCWSLLTFIDANRADIEIVFIDNYTVKIVSNQVVLMIVTL